MKAYHSVMQASHSRRSSVCLPRVLMLVGYVVQQKSDPVVALEVDTQVLSTEAHSGMCLA